MTARPPVVPALIRRHAEDAAFYWSQIDASIESPQLTWLRLADFDGLLSAHLEGLAVAGPDGVGPALSALERWGQPGEAFACLWLALRSGEAELQDRVLEQIKRQPDSLIRGAVSAMARLPLESAAPALARWTSADADPVSTVIALRAVVHLGAEAPSALALPLAHWLEAENPYVSAAACRAGVHGGADLAAALRRQLQHADPVVRAEAAIALALREDTQGVAAVLWQAVADQAKHGESATGWNRKQAQRRLNRWVRHLAWIAPFGHADIDELYRFLPPRAGLAFALHHGDARHLPYVLDRMAEPELARYAGWVWQSLTGIDLNGNELILAEPDPSDQDWSQALTEARLDADNGLPLPDVAAVRAVQAEIRGDLVEGERILMGEPISLELLAELLHDAPQALRSVAALALKYGAPEHTVDVRAEVRLQATALHELQRAVED